MVWIKGPRCGIDNCTSRFYQILSGQRVCQFGHVQVGVETTGDDDDFQAIGRRLTRPRSEKTASQLAAAASSSRDSDILRGRAAKLKTVELLQTVFRCQIEFVAARKQLPHTFVVASRDLWKAFLAHKGLDNISIVELVALSYLCTRSLDFPVLLSEFHLWIRFDDDFPYFDAWKRVNSRDYARIPAELRRHFRPAAEPGTFVLHTTVRKLRNAVFSKFKSSLPPIDSRYVCFRVCRDLMFAPQVYVGALRLLELVERKHIRRNEKLVWMEELPGVFAIAVSAKLYYGLDGVPRKPPDKRRGTNFSWGVWHDLMCKVWLMQRDYGRAEEWTVQYWSGNEIDSYLAWFQSKLGNSAELDSRLATFFPEPQIKSQDSDPNLAGSEVIADLCSILHASTPDESPTDEPLKPPGSHYQMYSVLHTSSDEMPELTAMLYKVLAVLLGADEMHIRRMVRLFEKWVKVEHPKLLKQTQRGASTERSE